MHKGLDFYVEWSYQISIFMGNCWGGSLILFIVSVLFHLHKRSSMHKGLDFYVEWSYQISSHPPPPPPPPPPPNQKKKKKEGKNAELEITFLSELPPE
jgi:hypothetical protein